MGRTRIARMLTAAAVVAALGAPAPAPATPDEGVSAVAAQQYVPVVVAPGATVTWTNLDAAVLPHTASYPPSCGLELTEPCEWSTDLMTLQDPVASATVNAEPGIYQYYCKRHPAMRGILVVADR